MPAPHRDSVDRPARCYPSAVFDRLRALVRRRASGAGGRKAHVHVTWDGGFYVDAAELLADPEVQERIRELSRALRGTFVPEPRRPAGTPETEPG